MFIILRKLNSKCPQVVVTSEAPLVAGTGRVIGLSDWIIWAGPVVRAD